jgi:protein-S-isoprenylcysteine O-methyltransferase Ste14
VLDTILRIALPLLTGTFLAGLAIRRARLRAALGHDPVRLTPFRNLDTPHGFLEATLGAAMLVLIVDMLLFTWSPAAMAAFAVPALRGSESVRWLGAAALLTGFVLMSLSVGAMGESWRMGIDRDRPGALVRTGLYRRLRHPIYLGMQLVTWGAGLATGQVIALCVAAAATIGVNIQARLEEAFLLSRYGDEYERYLRQSGRFWPRSG